LAKNWQKVGKKLAKGWQKIGKRLAKDWQSLLFYNTKSLNKVLTAKLFLEKSVFK
jgi:hypothetical protein